MLLHEREIYGFIHFLGDIGGIHEITFLILSLLILPISKHDFIAKAINKMYLIKTTDQNLLHEYEKRDEELG